MSIEKHISLKPNETIIHIVRRYGLTLFWQWFGVAFFIVTPFFFMFWLFRQNAWGPILFFVSIAIGLFLFFRAMFLWRKTAFVVTSERIIDIYYKGFFSKEISDLGYDQVENIGGKITGFWGTVFRFGTLSVQTSSERISIVVERVKYPVRVQQKIARLRRLYLKKQDIPDVCEFVEEHIDSMERKELIKLYKVIKKKLRATKEEKSE